jgi:hypothetical protein
VRYFLCLFVTEKRLMLFCFMFFCCPTQLLIDARARSTRVTLELLWKNFFPQERAICFNISFILPFGISLQKFTLLCLLSVVVIIVICSFQKQFHEKRKRCFERKKKINLLILKSLNHFKEQYSNQILMCFTNITIIHHSACEATHFSLFVQPTGFNG